VSRRPGNIEAADPFPRTGLTKQYEPFIRKFVGKFCDEYPGAIYEHVLVDAVRISMGAEARFKLEFGWDFSTFLRKHLLGLNRLYWNDRRQIKTPELGEKAADDPIGPLTYSGGNGTRITIDRRWHNGSGWQRVVLTLQAIATALRHKQATPPEIRQWLRDEGLEDLVTRHMRGVS
jgi:hypothetical protein